MLLNKRIFFQKFTARGQSIGQNLCAVRFAKMGLFKNSKHIVFASIQRREIQRLQAFLQAQAVPAVWQRMVWLGHRSGR